LEAAAEPSSSWLKILHLHLHLHLPQLAVHQKELN
jgi:hypothetical protein